MHVPPRTHNMGSNRPHSICVQEIEIGYFTGKVCMQIQVETFMNMNRNGVRGK